MPATHIAFSVPAAVASFLAFDTGATAPLASVKFVFGGKQEPVKITQIMGFTREPNITFDPAAKPDEATIFFVQNPITNSASSAFLIFVDNPGSDPQDLHVSAVWD